MIEIYLCGPISRSGFKSHSTVHSIIRNRRNAKGVRTLGTTSIDVQRRLISNGNTEATESVEVGD